MKKILQNIMLNKFFSTPMPKRRIKSFTAIMLIGLLLVFSLSNCKKSCITCYQQSGSNLRYDSSITVSYNTVLHHYDTLLVKVDTILKKDSIYLLHYCPGSQEYNTIAGYEINNGEYACGYDQ